MRQITKIKKATPATQIINKKFHNYMSNFTYTYKGRFFDRDSMRFFGSKVYEGMYHDRFFITSEKQSYEHKRYYTIRIVDALGNIETLGDFQGFNTKKQAENFISKKCSLEMANICALLVLSYGTGKYLTQINSYINKNKKDYMFLKENKLLSSFIFESFEYKINPNKFLKGSN